MTMVEGLQEKLMNRISRIRSRIAPRLSRPVELLTPLFLPMLTKEKRHESNNPFQPLYAEAIAPRLPHAPQDAYRWKRRDT